MKRFSKRFLSIFLAVLMVISMLPVTALTAFADDYVANHSKDSYSSSVNDYLEGQFNFDTDLSGVDGEGNTIDAVNVNGVIRSNSMGVRNGVIQVTGADTPGSYFDASKNPLSGKDLSDGATVTFWQYQYHNKDSISSGYGYNPVVTFYQDQYHYVAFTYGGYILYADGASSGSGIYRDYKTDGSTDIAGVAYNSTTVTAETNAVWCHYGFTVTNTGVSIYVGGVRYDYTTNDGDSSAASDTTANYGSDQYSDSGTIPSNILDFISDSNTTLSIGAYKPFTQSGYVNYVDDVRLYSKALTQVEIRSIYGENDSSIYEYAEGHDPTIVENENYGKSGYEGEYQYYMFGTAMTIYGSNDLANWTELADSQGRTGYQNEEYWGTAEGVGADYITVLKDNATTTGTAAPLAWSAKSGDYSNDSNGTGAGKMVWAPSVYYNSSTGYYMMVAATSSWGSSVSCIFTAKSKSIEGPYYDITPLLYSGFHDKAGSTSTSAGVKDKLDAVDGYTYSDDSSNPQRKYIYKSWFSYYYSSSTYPNCIDACPFYGKDGNLYMSFGSWSGGIWMVKLDDDGLSTDAQWMYDNGYDPYFGVKVGATTTETSSGSGSGEGSFCYYNSDNGYTYMNISYGSVHSGSYTMRSWKTDADCPMAATFTDATGNSPTTASSDSFQTGLKLMGSYSITGSNTMYNDNGHCSYIITKTGKTMLAYHTRFDESDESERSLTSTNYLNEARVHQVLYNQDNTECVLPYQYSGETFSTTADYNDGDNNSIAGTYSLVNHGTTMSNEYNYGTKYAFTNATDSDVRGSILDSSSSVVGVWFVSNNYITYTINNVSYKGCLVKMTDETGKERLVFTSAGSSTNETVWGIQIAPSASSAAEWTNPNADLSIDPVVYVHSEDGTKNEVSNQYYGTEIEDGTYTTDEVCNVYIADGWSIASVTNSDGNANGESYDVTGVKSTKTVNDEKINAHYLTGTVATDPKGGEGYDLALDVTYYNDNDPANQYVETVYTWVYSSTLEAHGVTAYYRSWTSGWSTKYRALGFALKLQGSEGSTPNYTEYKTGEESNYGVGNYRALSDFTSKSYITSEVDNSSKDATIAMNLGADIVAGIYAIRYGGSGDNKASFTTVYGTYYLDKSSSNLPSGVTIDDKYNWSITAPIAGVAEYRGMYETQYISACSADGVTWDLTTNTQVTNKTKTEDGYTDTGSLLAALYTTGQGAAPTSVYDSKITGTGTVEDATISITETHNADISGVVQLNPRVYVSDKSIVRAALEEATDLDLQSNKNYTDETWTSFIESVRVANAFVNNYKYMPTNKTDYDFSEQDIEVTAGGSTYTITLDSYNKGIVKKDGNQIFSTDLSSDSTTQDVFAAWINQQYDDLFDLDLYDDFLDNYTEANRIIVSIGDGYTESSYTDFNLVMDEIKVYASFINDVDVEDGETSWREISDDELNYGTSNSYTAKENYEIAVYKLQNAIDQLRVIADYTDLEDEISSKDNVFAQSVGLYTDTDNDNQFDSSVDTQNYTISSWVPYANSYKAATTTEAAKTTDDLHYVDKEETRTNPVTGETTKITIDDTDNNSPLQININDCTDDLNEKVNNLKAVDEDLSYEAFESAVIVANNIDKNKYVSTADLDAKITDLRDNTVYYTLTDDDATAINAIATKQVTSGTVFKNTAYQETDPCTAELLELINTMNDTSNGYVKQLNATLTIDDNGTQTTTQLEPKYYGDKFVFDSGADDDTTVTWSITSYDYNHSVSDDPVIKSTKVTTNSSTLTLIADQDLAVTAFVKTAAQASNYVVNVYNIYGKVVAIDYTDSETYDTSSLTESAVPFYTFKKWTQSVSGNVISVRPVYYADPSCVVSVTDGTVSATSVEFNTAVTVDGSSISNFYAWASTVDDGATYSVASYEPSYTLYAVADKEQFVPITLVDGKYYLDGTEITDDNAESLFGITTTFDYESYGLTYAQYITSKLDTKAPFISVNKVSSEEVADSSKKKYYAYCRVTYGADYTACGIVMNNGSKEVEKNVTNILSNGQFYASITSANTITFKATVNYDYAIDFGGTNTDQNVNTNISVTDTTASK